MRIDVFDQSAFHYGAGTNLAVRGAVALFAVLSLVHLALDTADPKSTALGATLGALFLLDFGINACLLLLFVRPMAALHRAALARDFSASARRRHAGSVSSAAHFSPRGACPAMAAQEQGYLDVAARYAVLTCALSRVCMLRRRVAEYAPVSRS